jgi:hypothetical protein
MSVNFTFFYLVYSRGESGMGREVIKSKSKYDVMKWNEFLMRALDTYFIGFDNVTGEALAFIRLDRRVLFYTTY